MPMVKVDPPSSMTPDKVRVPVPPKVDAAPSVMVPAADPVPVPVMTPADDMPVPLTVSGSAATSTPLIFRQPPLLTVVPVPVPPNALMFCAEIVAPELIVVVPV